MLDYESPYVTVGGAANMPTATSASGHPSPVIDGTPMRVAVIVLVSAAGLVVIRKAGFKFSSTVSVS